MVDFLTITVTSRAQPIVKQGDGPVLLFNNDIANTIYLGEDLGVTSRQLDIGQIQPLGQVGVDGSRTIYAVTAIGKTAQLLVFPSGTSYSASPALIATSIAASGIPLLQGVDAILSGSSQTIPAASGLVQEYDVNVSKPGYVVRFDAQFAAGGVTVPFVGIDFNWHDPTDSFRVGHEFWVIPVTALSGLYRIMGRGICKGSVLIISFQNFDPAVSLSITTTLLETTQNISRDDWRGLDPDNVPTYNIPSGSLASNVLANNIGISVPASGSLSFLMPLYCGQVLLSTAFPAAGSVTTQWQSPANIGALSSMTVYNNANGGQLQQIPVSLPRCPTVLTFVNNGAVIVNGSFSVVPLEYVS